MLNNKGEISGYVLAWKHFIYGKKPNFLTHIIRDYEEKENYEGCLGIYKAIDEYKGYVDTIKKLIKRAGVKNNN